MAGPGNGTQSPHLALGTFVEPTATANGVLRAEIDLSEKEYDELLDAIRAVERCATPFAYRVVERNFIDFIDLHEFATVTLSLGRRFATPDRLSLGGNVMSAIINWLTATRLFLDHTSTDLKRRFGRTSAEVEHFTRATNEAFDNHVGYRFMYKLRNYVQHCGLPLTRIEGQAVDSEDPDNRRQLVTLVLDRDELINTYKEWGPVLADLRQMSANVPLLPLADDAMDGMRSVYGVLLRLELDQAVEHCSVLHTALGRIREMELEGLPGVFSIRQSGDDLDFEAKYFAAETVEKLFAVASGAKPRESLFAAPQAPKRRLSADDLRAGFERDNRGAQVLDAWFAVGPSQSLADTINGIIAADGGADPLITGLINTSALLAHLAAGALGRTAEGLVAGLLDAYENADTAGESIAPA